MPIYMKMEGVPLTGTGKGKHKGWIELESCQFITPQTRGTVSGNKKATPSVTEIVVTKELDETSETLFRLSLWGRGKKVTIDFTNKDSDDAYLTLVLENTLIAFYNVSNGGGTSRIPIEALGLNFTKISYTTQKAPDSGGAKTGRDATSWDTGQDSGGF
jgi:type VI secretion system secreted protein Hcp